MTTRTWGSMQLKRGCQHTASNITCHVCRRRCSAAALSTPWRTLELTDKDRCAVWLVHAAVCDQGCNACRVVSLLVDNESSHVECSQRC